MTITPMKFSKISRMCYYWIITKKERECEFSYVEGY